MGLFRRKSAAWGFVVSWSARRRFRGGVYCRGFLAGIGKKASKKWGEVDEGEGKKGCVSVALVKHASSANDEKDAVQVERSCK